MVTVLIVTAYDADAVADLAREAAEIRAYLCEGNCGEPIADATPRTLTADGHVRLCEWCAAHICLSCQLPMARTAAGPTCPDCPTPGCKAPDAIARDLARCFEAFEATYYNLGLAIRDASELLGDRAEQTERIARG